jgi:MerR family transcriptional regulator, copper efflux regulator
MVDSAGRAGKLRGIVKPYQGVPMRRPTAPNLGEYLTVKEAAQILGVSPETLRNWDQAGKFKAVRHPVNGYRLYRRERLETLLNAIARAE